MKFSNYEEIKKIGHGQYGDVFLVRKLNETSINMHQKQDEYFALKKIAKNKYHQDAECEILCDIHHPNIVKIFDIVHNEHDTSLVMEYAS